MTKLIICFLILMGSFGIQGHASSHLTMQDVVMDQDSVHVKFVRGGAGMARLKCILDMDTKNGDLFF
jgi:hypothetical protein